MYSRVYVEITNICNMNCSFCHGHSRAPGAMSIEEFSRVLDSLEEHTKYIYYHLMGEPLKHPQLPEFIRLAGERGFKSMITTNGTLLEERGHEILEAGLHKVNISLHSFEEGGEEQHEAYMAKVADFADKASKAGTIVVIRLWNKGCDGGRNDSAHNYDTARYCNSADGWRHKRQFRWRRITFNSAGIGTDNARSCQDTVI